MQRQKQNSFALHYEHFRILVLSTEGRAKIGTNKFDEAMNSLFASVSVKPGFHLIFTIAMIAVAAGKKCSAQ